MQKILGRRLVCLMATGSALLALPCLSTAAPSADAWARWKPSDTQSTATIDNSAYDTFLDDYVVSHHNGPNGVRYGDVSSADRKKLEQYIDQLEGLDIASYNRTVQRAYWINLYNAETLDLVLSAYPVDSIKAVGGGFFNRGPWDKKVLMVDGVKLSLNDIEHRILRPFWPDGMTHYGVNCASISCPSLLAKAYKGSDVDQMLRANAKAYINSQQGVSVDGNTVTLSSIYDWYRADFGGNAAGVLDHLRQFAAPKLSAQLDTLDHIDGYAYNWALNSEDNIKRQPAN